MRKPLRIAAWVALVALTGVIAWNSWPYFHAPRSHNFVIEKGTLGNDPVYLGVLILHVAAGIVCLGSSFLQFHRRLLTRIPALHRWLGRAYTFSVLVVLTPTGLFLAPTAHGGVAGSAGFILLGVLTFATTWRGWSEARRGNMRSHGRWMMRSFAMAVSAITFRLIHGGFGLVGLDVETGYMLALYLSIFGNAAAAEFLLFKMSRPRSRRAPAQQTEKHHETTHAIPRHAPLH